MLCKHLFLIFSLMLALYSLNLHCTLFQLICIVCFFSPLLFVQWALSSSLCDIHEIKVCVFFHAENIPVLQLTCSGGGRSKLCKNLSLFLFILRNSGQTKDGKRRGSFYDTNNMTHHRNESLNVNVKSFIH